MRNFITLMFAVMGLAAASNLGAADSYRSDKDMQDIIKTSQDWNKAMLNGDTVAMEKILSDEFTFVDSTGNTINKQQEIGAYKDGSLKFESITAGATRTRLYVGGAVVSGTVSIKAKYKTEDISGEYRFLDVYEPAKGGGWQAVFSQITKVPEKK